MWKGHITKNGDKIYLFGKKSVRIYNSKSGDLVNERSLSWDNKSYCNKAYCLTNNEEWVTRRFADRSSMRKGFLSSQNFDLCERMATERVGRNRWIFVLSSKADRSFVSNFHFDSKSFQSGRVPLKNQSFTVEKTEDIQVRLRCVGANDEYVLCLIFDQFRSSSGVPLVVERTRRNLADALRRAVSSHQFNGSVRFRSSERRNSLLGFDHRWSARRRCSETQTEQQSSEFVQRRKCRTDSSFARSRVGSFGLFGKRFDRHCNDDIDQFIRSKEFRCYSSNGSAGRAVVHLADEQSGSGENAAHHRWFRSNKFYRFIIEPMIDRCLPRRWIFNFDRSFNRSIWFPRRRCWTTTKRRKSTRWFCSTIKLYNYSIRINFLRRISNRKVYLPKSKITTYVTFPSSFLFLRRKRMAIRSHLFIVLEEEFLRGYRTFCRRVPSEMFINLVYLHRQRMSSFVFLI